MKQGLRTEMREMKVLSDCYRSERLWRTLLSRSESGECVGVWFCGACNSDKRDAFNDSRSHVTVMRFESLLARLF